MNKEKILNKADEIVNYIKTTEIYNNYLKSREILKKDNEINELIKRIKKNQQAIVNNASNSKELEEEIDCCLVNLNNNSTYIEYLTYQEEINNMLIILENKLNKYFFDIFN